MVDNIELISKTVTTIFRNASGHMFITLPVDDGSGSRGFKNLHIKGLPFKGVFSNGVFFLTKPVSEHYFHTIEVLVDHYGGKGEQAITYEDYRRATILISEGLKRGPVVTASMATQSIACADIIGVLTNNVLASKVFKSQRPLANLLREQGQKLVNTIELNLPAALMFKRSMVLSRYRGLPSTTRLPFA